MKKLLFAVLATFVILGCSSNDDMPCVTCGSENYWPNSISYSSANDDYRWSSSSFSIISNSSSSSSSLIYCLYGNWSNYVCSSVSTKDYCSSMYGGEIYVNDRTCGNYWWSSSSAIPSSSSEYVGGSCDMDEYEWVYIGYQTWTATNVDCYVSGSKCYDNDPYNCDKYGRLYSWSAAMKVCPEGWHLPSKEDWEELFSYAENDDGEYDENYLKSTKGWGSGKNGNDENYFTALPGGNGADGYFYRIGSHGYWWSSTESSNTKAYYLHIYSGEGLITDSKNYLFSVRCLQDW